MTTALITHPDCLGHETPEGHPEQIARLEHVLAALEGKELRRVTAPLVAEDDLLRVHPHSHIETIRAAAPKEGIIQLDADTYMSPGTLAAAHRAAGGAVRAVDLVISGEAQNAFVATRPPGHHAERETTMGFCLFGNIAVAAKHALDHHGLSRVAIVDFDVHHGNGTQDLLEDDARALFVSSHQFPLWPGTGTADDTGPHDTILNLPLAPGTGGEGFRKIYEDKVFPAVTAFKPDLLLISAGFDAHRDDPLADLRLTEDDFAWVTGRLCDLADDLCGGRVVSCLEGGYNLMALAQSAAAHVDVLIARGAA
ncbi:Histone deacetylase-like amidohydrolase [Roseovarius gaetbuli]|uniref:Histone deacetylase-like amidohydrolase n=1 Tax=Roseovarius gaetbuli TaxID=1356575 RepID=A0A1X6YKS0_9RHOB|nr:histone deacetylase family protein [Roseovarius gaetbuli]SLN23736.1 Histone deacetylase-like amidohydrolase [Roseovarius gaetbuli]